MGLRPLLGPPCIPPEAPCWGFPVSVIQRGLRGFCSGSFLATLGDLPARRAMPACTSALNARPREHLIGCRKLQKWRALATDKLINRKIWTWACSLRDIFSALRARRLFFNLVWAACAAGGRWGPVRGCRPSEAPSALPPDDPAGFVVYPTLPRTGLQGPSISHHSTRAARLLLRELPRYAR